VSVFLVKQGVLTLSASTVVVWGGNDRMIRAAIRAARKEGVPEVEVTFGDGSTVRIPLTAPEKTLAETEEVVL
jgi:hypothetical protein